MRLGEDPLIQEELGDVLLQVLFHSVIAEERQAFDMSDVAGGLVAKMRARHPHLYEGGEKVPWERMKASKRSSIEDGLPPGLPSLHRAHRLQDRAAGVGFDWPDAQGPLDKVHEELAEVRSQLPDSIPDSRFPLPAARQAALEAELGDLLFAVVNLCRKCDVHAALALDKANEKFVRRWTTIEKLAAQRNIDVPKAGLETLDKLWDEVKLTEATGHRPQTTEEPLG